VQTGAALFANNCQYCWMLHVASVCTPCCTLLRVVGSCCAKLQTGQTFSYVQTDTTLLAYNSFARRFRRPRCRGRGRILRSLIRISLTHLYYTSLLGCVQTDATMLGVVACVLAVVCKRIQQLPQCWDCSASWEGYNP